MILADAIATRLEELMQQQNITQYKLSQLSGVSQSTISDIRLKKNKSVNIAIIHELADGLKMGLDEFFQSPIFKRENID